jgi:uncharacterized membrane protein YeaQ/YmgE (transglycosylase-associated protein family)
MISELTIVLFGQTVLGSVLVLFMYQKVKELLHASGVLATVLAFVFGAVLGAVANLLGFVGEVSILYSIVQGLVSAWVATGGYDLLFKGRQ